MRSGYYLVFDEDTLEETIRDTIEPYNNFLDCQADAVDYRNRKEIDDYKIYYITIKRVE